MERIKGAAKRPNSTLTGQTENTKKGKPGAFETNRKSTVDNGGSTERRGADRKRLFSTQPEKHDVNEHDTRGRQNDLKKKSSVSIAKKRGQKPWGRR